MKYTTLPATGLTISRVALGTMSFGDHRVEPWLLDEHQARSIVREAVEAGVTFFDTADSYSDGLSEILTGQLLREHLPNRQDYVLATKVYYPTGRGHNSRGLSRKHLRAAIDASLRRLGTDHVDLYQVHRWDDATPIEETMGALQDIVAAGKALYAGASGLSAWQLAKAQRATAGNTAGRYVTVQNRYSLLHREDERDMIPMCADTNVGFLSYSPLARGRLAGSRRSGSEVSPRAAADVPTGASIHADDRAVIDAVLRACEGSALTPAELSMAWVLQRPGVTAAIVGATRPGHVAAAARATELRLPEEVVAAVEAAYLPRPAPLYS